MNTDFHITRRKCADQGLSSWGFNLGGQHSTYHALFPRAWTVYDGISHLSGDHVNEPFRGKDGVSGVLLHHNTTKGNHPVTFVVAACETQNVNVTVLPSFGLSKGRCVTAKEMWGKMEQDGHFDQSNFNMGTTVPSSAGDANCAAVSASAWVEPNGKRYTRCYGTSERVAEDLVHDSLITKHYKRWEEEIEKWQNPILKNDKLPEW
ncbi:hypothetical protein R6Q57_024153 [Mikania cordata]